MDKVRFSVGGTHVFQGYSKKGDGDHSIGDYVWVTASTLREIVDHIMNDIFSTDFDREHNAPEYEMGMLAFGGSTADDDIRVAPDGFTPLYKSVTFGATIVQRYDPTVPMRATNPDGFKGRWFNEETIDGFCGGWSDEAPGTFEPVTHGFTINRQDVAEDRSDAPLIETNADREAAKAAVIRSGDGMLPPGLYYDHEGRVTSDPRCELGFCVVCIDESLDRGETPIIPSLSTHDPRYATDPDYRVAVRDALAVAGVTLREDVDNG